MADEDINRTPQSHSSREGKTDKGDIMSFENFNSTSRSKRNRKEKTFDDFYVFGRRASTSVIEKEADDIVGETVNILFDSSATSNAATSCDKAAGSAVKESSNLNSSSSLEVSTTASIKKKRGRPPRVKTAMDGQAKHLSSVKATNSLQSMQSSDRKKRKYEEMDRDESILYDSPTNEVIRLAGMEDSSNSTSVTHKSVTPISSKGSNQLNSNTLTGSVVKRGRGRPKKQDVEMRSFQTGDADGIAFDGQNQECVTRVSNQRSFQSKDGEERLSFVVQPNTKTSSSLRLMIKQGRGRPRKDSSTFIRSPLVRSDVFDDNKTMTGEKRGRGRPRKDSSSFIRSPQVRNYISGNRKSVTDEKRGRGRPRKDCSLFNRNIQVRNDTFDEDKTMPYGNKSSDGERADRQIRKRKFHFDLSDSDIEGSLSDIEMNNTISSWRRGRGRGKRARGTGRGLSGNFSSESNKSDLQYRNILLKYRRGRGVWERGRPRGRPNWGRGVARGRGISRGISRASNHDASAEKLKVNHENLSTTLRRSRGTWARGRPKKNRGWGRGRRIDVSNGSDLDDPIGNSNDEYITITSTTHGRGLGTWTRGRKKRGRGLFQGRGRGIEVSSRSDYDDLVNSCEEEDQNISSAHERDQNQGCRGQGRSREFPDGVDDDDDDSLNSCEVEATRVYLSRGRGRGVWVRGRCKRGRCFARGRGRGREVLSGSDHDNPLSSCEGEDQNISSTHERDQSQRSRIIRDGADHDDDSLNSSEVAGKNIYSSRGIGRGVRPRGRRTRGRGVAHGGGGGMEFPSGSDHDDLLDSCEAEDKSILSTHRRGRGHGKRGKGRHRSRDISSGSNSDSSFTDKELEYTPSTSSARGRGRGKRGRGRGRGRGRSQVTHDPCDTSPSEITCVHCKLVIHTLKVYKAHLANKHSLLYTPGNPDGIDDSINIVKQYGHVFCQKCSRRFQNPQYYKHHVIWCGRESETFICDICKKSSPAQWEKQHVRNCIKQQALKALAEAKKQEALEKKEQNLLAEEEEGKSGVKIQRKAARSALSMLHKIEDNENETLHSSGDDASIDDMEEDEDGDITSDDDEDSDSFEGGTDQEDNAVRGKSRKTTHKKKKNKAKKTAKDAFWIEICESVSKMEGKMSDAARIQCLHDFYYDSNKTVLFPDLLPEVEEWKALSLSDKERYFSSSKQSPLISCNKSQSPESQTSFSLRMGEAIYKSDENKGFCYTGGPIWAIEWCPIPTLSPQEQIVAVASDGGAGLRSPINVVEEGSNLLQFWSLRGSDSESDVQSPRLAFCIAHDSGYVRSLAWCPKGCYDKDYSGEDNQQPDKYMLRQGLLAVACSNSSILVFSIPKTSSVESVFQSTQDSEKPIVVKPKPCRRLIPNSQSDATPCLCVSWQNSEKCQWIIGGYGRGEILMWALDAASPTLICEDDNTLRPIRAFIRHRSGVADCAFCPSIPHLFTSCDFGGNIIIWNANRPQEPESMMTKTRFVIIKAICWAGPICWGFFTASDRFFIPDKHCRTADRHSVKFNGISPLCCPSSDLSTGVAVHPVCIWDVTYNPLFSVLVTCDAVGNVLVSLPSERRLLAGTPPWSTFLFSHQTSHAVLYKASVKKDVPRVASGANALQGVQQPDDAGQLSTSNGGSKVLVASTGDDADTRERETDSTKQSNDENRSHNFTLRYEECKMDYSDLSKPVVTKSRITEKIQIQEEEKFGGSNLEAIHRVRLCPGLGPKLWLASGGNSGLLRIESLADLVIPHRRNLESCLHRFKQELASGSS